MALIVAMEQEFDHFLVKKKKKKKNNPWIRSLYTKWRFYPVDGISNTLAKEQDNLLIWR